MKRSAVLALLVASATVATPAFARHPQRSDLDIVELAREAGSFTILIAALEKTGLDAALKEEGPFTVLAPPDAAFEALLDELGISAGELLDNPNLADILLYHVIGGEFSSWKISWLESATTLQGSDVKVTALWRWFSRFRTIFINDAKVVQADIFATNGVIHVIDTVLMPPMDIVATAKAAGTFTTLVAALEATGLDEALKGEGPFTVFAPTDEAFESLLAELGITAEELLANPDLSTILLYHVISGDVRAGDLKSRMSVTTLAEKDVHIRVFWRWFPRFRKIFVNDSRVVQADILASNGVIHVINKVLLPPAD